MERETFRRACRALLLQNGFVETVKGIRVPASFDCSKAEVGAVYVVNDKVWLNRRVAEEWREDTRDGASYELEKVGIVEAVNSSLAFIDKLL